MKYFIDQFTVLKQVTITGNGIIKIKIRFIISINKQYKEITHTIGDSSIDYCHKKKKKIIFWEEGKRPNK